MYNIVDNTEYKDPANTNSSYEVVCLFSCYLVWLKLIADTDTRNLKLLKLNKNREISNLGNWRQRLLTWILLHIAGE